MATSREVRLSYKNSDVVIVTAARTPVGSHNGDLSSLKAHELGTIVIREVLTRAGVPPCDVSEVILGQVCTAGKTFKSCWRNQHYFTRTCIDQVEI